MEGNTWQSLAAGLRFLVSRKVILATITLDMVAVFLGGATALLPIFADQILHCGPIGLGWMRGAPGIGGLAMAVADGIFAADGKAGKHCFGVWRALVWPRSSSALDNLGLSLGHAFSIGAFDSVSVIIRGSIVQLVTPDEMRGRVSAVNNIFIGTSNEFGALESGLTAALLVR